MKKRSGCKVVFVAGTDTGVGKTFLTALMLSHLRAQGCDVLAVKPFSSGGRGDARLLNSLQGSTVTLDDMNPFHFSMPLAPLVAARSEGRKLIKRDAIRYLRASVKKVEILLVEGAGGLLTPLGENFTLVDLTSDVNASVLLVVPNRLGVLNQAAMATQCLESAGIKKKVVGLSSVNLRKNDRSVITNRVYLSEILRKIPIFEVPFTKIDGRKIEVLNKTAKKHSKLLASIWESL